MKQITTNGGSIVLSGEGRPSESIPKGQQFTTTAGGNLVVVTGGGKRWELFATETTVDGESFGTAEELQDKLSSFSRGGGDGDGVTQEELDERVPVLDEGNFLVGGVSGSAQRKITSQDLGYTSGGGLRLVSILNGEFVNPYPGSSAVLNNSLVVRSSTGQGKLSPAVEGDDAVVLSQFRGVVNDTLTAAETSATLNAAYPSVVIGFTVTSGTTEYKKKTPSTWTKRTIENV